MWNISAFNNLQSIDKPKKITKNKSNKIKTTKNLNCFSHLVSEKGFVPLHPTKKYS